MDTSKLKYVVGKAEKDSPAIIRFFDSVDYHSVRDFNEEFLWLQDSVKPSKIVVLINSEGGSVLYGMSAFSVIQSCPIEVDCVIEGVAASMASVIWAAGDNLYMHDYSILMIHNPFASDGGSVDESVTNAVNAFRGQLEVIYNKRFGMDKEDVRRIMDGEGDTDGTYFTACEAVGAGILPKDNVIKTSKSVCEKAKSKIEGVSGAASLREVMTSIAAEVGEDRLLEKLSAIHNKNKHNFQEQKAMENKENMNFGAVCAQLGFPVDVPVTNVSGRISDLLKAEGELKDVKSQLGDLRIKYQGKEAEVKNVGDKLAEAEASLKKYRDAEKAALEAEIDNEVQAAIDAGKIDDSAKASWVAMAKSNFQMVRETLASIPGREKVSKAIADDPENVKHIQDEMKTAEDRMKERVEAVVGKIEFEKF